MEENNKPVIGITCGDLNGIGFEIILKTLNAPEIVDFCTPVVFASSKVASYHRKALGMQDMNFHVINSLEQLNAKRPNLLNAWREDVNLEYGALSDEVGSFALKSIDAALEAWKKGEIQGMVTAPINKNNIANTPEPFTGHTGYLGAATGGDPLMILCTDQLRVALVTGHVPIQKVSESLSKALIMSKINQLHKSLVEDFGIRKPKIGVLGLNPHAGDGGIMGNEEAEIIAPAIEEATEKGKLVFGPYAADGYFAAKTYQQFDATLAMYHDQGLIPFKTLAFHEGVNFTAGLPLVRTSPDHGTGMAIAGTGQAEENSFRQALYMAVDVIKQRADYREITANPLKTTHKKRE